MTALATTVQAFFSDRLIRQRHASPHTLAAYRDTLRLLLVFASAQRNTQPSKLDIDDLDAPLVGAFLDHLEHQRANGVRTRNARLAAVRSLFRYAALRHPEHAAVIERVLAIPPKRFERRLVTFLTEPELDALLAAPAATTWTGRRDRALPRRPSRDDLDRPARPRPSRARRSDRSAGVRIDRSPVRRHPSRCWRPCQLLGQGAKAADHATHLGHGRRPACLARRACRSTDGPVVRDTERNGAQP